MSELDTINGFGYAYFRVFLDLKDFWVAVFLEESDFRCSDGVGCGWRRTMRGL